MRKTSSWNLKTVWPTGFAVLMALAAWPVVCRAQGFGADVTPKVFEDDQTVLSKAEVKLDAAGITAYLRSLAPSAQTTKEVDDLIKQLGADEWVQREAAGKKLSQMSLVAMAALRKAAEAGDPEVSSRAKAIIESAPGPRILSAALGVTASQKLAVPVPVILAVAPLCEDDSLRLALRGALKTAATEKDLDQLRKVLKGDDMGLRLAVLPAILKVRGKDAGDDLVAGLTGASEPVQLAVARKLARLADRRSLDALAKLLDSKDSTIRVGSGTLFQGITGKDFGLLKTLDDAARQKAVQAARDWLAGEGKSAKLNFEAATPREWGRTLVCLSQTGMVVEFDARGQKTWSKELEGAWCCQGLPNGHRLVSSNTLKKVVEYDENGTEIWKKEELPGSPQGIERLANGNTLIACREANKILEVKPDGTTEKEVNVEGEPMLVQRLEDGLMLVVLKGLDTVAEVDGDGKVGWKLENQTDVMGAYRKPNGHTVVTHSDQCKVVEYDHEGKEVFTTAMPGGFFGPKGVAGTSNGNVLVAGIPGVAEIDGEGKVVVVNNWGYASAVSRY